MEKFISMTSNKYKNIDKVIPSIYGKKRQKIFYLSLTTYSLIPVDNKISYITGKVIKFRDI